MAAKTKPVVLDTPIYYEDDDDIAGMENIPQWQIDEVDHALAQEARGEYVDYDELKAWVRSWGGENELPEPAIKYK